MAVKLKATASSFFNTEYTNTDSILKLTTLNNQKHILFTSYLIQMLEVLVEKQYVYKLSQRLSFCLGLQTQVTEGIFQLLMDIMF